MGIYQAVLASIQSPGVTPVNSAKISDVALGEYQHIVCHVMASGAEQAYYVLEAIMTAGTEGPTIIAQNEVVVFESNGAMRAVMVAAGTVYVSCTGIAASVIDWDFWFIRTEAK